MSPQTARLLSIALILGVAKLGLIRPMLLALAAIAASAAGALAVTRSAKRHELDEEAMAELRSAETLLRNGQALTAVVAACKAESHAVSARTRNAALTTLAWAALAEGYVERAEAALERINPPHFIDLHCYAAVQAACGRHELAIKALELARTGGGLDCAGVQLLVELYARQNRFDRAVAAALQSRNILGPNNCWKVVRAANEAGASEAAATLAATLGGPT